MTLFFRSLIADFRHTGAISPSSHRLSRLIAELAKEVCVSHILEVGAGTGAITKHLFDTSRAGDTPEVIVVERSMRFFDHLKERYPEHLHSILNADVCDLDPTSLPWRPRLIVSSVPLFSLDRSKRNAVVAKYSQLLAPESYWIQYTYSPHLAYFRQFREFTLIRSRFVLANFPPANVILLRRTSLGQAKFTGPRSSSDLPPSELVREAVPSTY